MSSGVKRGQQGRHRQSARGERSMVPEPEFTSYYGRPVIKAPVWKTPDVPLYFFAGGLAGASAVVAAVAGVAGGPGSSRGIQRPGGYRSLQRAGRLAAAVGSAVGVGALIHDLGRPERFLNMLRVARPTSPLSMGSWLLASFSGLASATAVSEVTGVAPRAGAAAGAGAAILGAPLATYTSVLIADTAVPAWHEAYAYLPAVFAASSAASAGAVGLIAAPPSESVPARRLAVAGATLAAASEQAMGRRLGMIGEPYHQGRSGMLMRTATVLTMAGAAGALVTRRSRIGTVLSGAALLGGSLCTRFGVFEAGRASAADPKYTVIPQRERLAAKDGGGSR